MMGVIDFRARPNTKDYMSAFNINHPPAGTLDEFISDLDRVGIDKAVYTNRQSYAGSLENSIVADHAASFPERLIPFAAVDPRKGDEVLKELETCIAHGPFKGVSLDPPDDYNSDPVRGFGDEALMYPVYEFAQASRVPVSLTFGPRTVAFGGVESVDRIARDFPDLTIVCSHAVWPEVNDWVALAVRRGNVVLEPSLYWHYPGTEPFFEAAQRTISDQVVYASGYPFDPLDSLAGMRQRFSDEAAWRKFSRDNAVRILGLEED